MKREKKIKAFLQEMPWIIDCLQSSAEVPKDVDARTGRDHVARWIIRNVGQIDKAHFTLPDVHRREFNQTCQTVRFDDKPFEPFYRRHFIFCLKDANRGTVNIYRHTSRKELTIKEIFQEKSYQETKGTLICVVQVETIGILGRCSTNSLQVLQTQL